MATIIGNNFSDLQSTKGYYDSLNTRIQQENAARAQSDYQFGVGQNTAAARQAEQDQRQAQAQAYGYFQDNQRTEAQTRAEANAAYQFNAQQASRKSEKDLAGKEFEESRSDANKQAEENRKAQIEIHNNALTATQIKTAVDFARKGIVSGVITDPKQLDSEEYSQLPDATKQMLKDEITAKKSQQADAGRVLNENKNIKPDAGFLMRNDLQHFPVSTNAAGTVAYQYGPRQPASGAGVVPPVATNAPNVTLNGKPITATDAQGNKIVYDPNMKKWLPMPIPQ